MIWTNTNVEWEQNTRLEGSLMIRPIFNPEFNDTSLVQGTRRQLDLQVFPNPMTSEFRLSGPHDRVEIISLSGQVLFSSERQEVYNVSFLRPGLYIARIYRNNLISSRKIIISHGN